MVIKISDNVVAVDTDYYWLPMSDCPRGVKVQLLGAGGVACYGTYNGRDSWWRAWAPLPKEKKDVPAGENSGAGDSASSQVDAAVRPDPADA